MKISLNILKQYIKFDDKLLIDIFSDIGLEIKKIEKIDDDTLITIELLANRGDHRSYLGIAKEISGYINIPLKEPFYADIYLSKNISKFKINSNNCIAYSLTEFKIDSNFLEIDWKEKYKYMLNVSGLNTISPVIDITNIITLELGQPTHIYDYDKIKGKLVVRESDTGEKAHLLFQDMPIELPKGTLIVSDMEKIISVAGVIGCNTALVDDNSRTILFESGLFNPIKIRKTSQILGIQTLSSQRFERGGDFAAIKKSIRRSIALYKAIGYNVISTQFKQNQKLPKRYIRINVKEASDYFDCNLTNITIINRLSPYGFIPKKYGKNNIIFLIPTSRIWDVILPVDLYEELGKSIGYNNLSSKLPFTDIGTLPTSKEKSKFDIDHYLVSKGFFEIFTDGLYSNEDAQIFKNNQLSNHIKVMNARDKGYALLKNNCLLQALQLVRENLRFKHNNIQVYEWSRIFIPDEQAINGICREIKILWGIINKTDFKWNETFKENINVFYVKGLMEGISHLLNVQLIFDTNLQNGSNPIMSMLHPLRSMRILSSDKQLVGLFGEVHPSILFALDIKIERPCYFQLDTDILLNLPTQDVKLSTSLINSNIVNRDICIEVPQYYPAGDIIDDIKKEDMVLDAKIIDIYKEKESTKRKITYTIYYRNNVTQYPVNVINNLTDNIKRTIEKKIII